MGCKQTKNIFCGIIEPDEISVLIALTSCKGSDGPAYMGSLTGAITSRIHKKDRQRKAQPNNRPVARLDTSEWAFK